MKSRNADTVAGMEHQTDRITPSYIDNNSVNTGRGADHSYRVVEMKITV